MADSVLITGASTGLGKVTALHLAERGFVVYAAMLDLADRAAVEEPAKARGLDVRAVQLDIRDRASIDAAVQTIVRETGGIFALVNNAGTRLRGCFEDLTDAEIRRLFDTNLFGTMGVCRAVLPYMRAARRGRILMMTSIAGRIGSFGVGAYCASKFAQEGFAESLAQEVKPFGIDVVVIEPAIIKTEAWGANRVTAAAAFNAASPYAAWFKRAEELADRMVKTSPTTPMHVAEAVYAALAHPPSRLRIAVGWRAQLVLTARKLVPASVFERVYFGQLMKMITSTATK